MKHFQLSFLITALCLSAAFYWSGIAGVMIALILGVLEVSLSFDNAVVNASILKRMDERWQRYFLTWGILVAVFGMRLIFPIAIVVFATGIDFVSVAQMALHDPLTYSMHLTASHVQIAAFGGMFLLMVFFSFIFDEGRELHWLGYIERKLSSFGKLQSIEVIFALGVLLVGQHGLPEDIRLKTLIAGISGVILYVIVDSLSALFEDEEQGEDVSEAIKKGSIMSFLYLEVLDASFSYSGSLIS